jgi:hypothetical protein
MDITELRKQHIAWNIQQNPTQITVHRTEKVDMGGYFDEAISTLGPFTVRIFAEGNRMPLDVTTLAGTKQIDKGWGLLADANANIKAGPNVLDEFDALGGHFIIKAVYPQYVKDELVGYQADLEKVS